jgi:hypothetical protein
MGGEAFGLFDPKGLPATMGGEEEVLPPRDEVVRQLEHLKWFLWHGHVFQALEALRVVEFVLKGAVCENGDATARKLYKVVREFPTFYTFSSHGSWNPIL